MMHFATIASCLAASAALVASQNEPLDPSTTRRCTFTWPWPDAQLPEQGETCASIAAFWGISERAFIIWNPIVGPNCSNLIPGNRYCLEENFSTEDPPEPSSSSLSPSSTVAPSSTSSSIPPPSSSSSSMTTTLPLSTSSPPTTVSTSVRSTSTGPAVPFPTQGGLTSDCQRFYLVENGDFCQGIVDEFGTFTLSQFYQWNPAVGTSCQGLQPSFYVCIGVSGTPTIRPTSTSASTTAQPTTTDPLRPSPTQGGLTPDCQRFYLVQSGDFCQAIVDQFGTFTLSQFYSWNPAVGTSCGGLQAGFHVCIGVSGTPTTRPTTTSAPTTVDPSRPSPTQAGLTPDCRRFYLVQPGDFCQGIVDQYRAFTLSQFYSWNPAIGNTCAGLQAGFYVCVGVAGTPTSPTSTAPTGVVTPTPIQSGVISTCNRFVKSSPSGATCQKFSGGNRISLAQLYAWNRVLGIRGENCVSQFRNSMNYCVSVSRPLPPPNNGPVQPGVPDTCIRYGDALPGGTCPLFANRFGISLSQLYAWNPALGRDGENCQTNFWSGYWYCVQVAG